MRLLSAWRGVVASISSGVLLVAICLTDLFVPDVSDFWSAHAMLTNVVSSLVLVLVGATILDQWLKREDTRKLRVIESAAYDAVARPLIAQWRILWLLINGDRQLGEADFEIPESDRDEIRRLHSKYGIGEVHHSEVSRGRAANPPDLDRICLLAVDEEWRVLTYRTVRRVVHGSRQVIARWAQLFVTSRRSSEVLEELVGCVSDLQALRTYMLPWLYEGRAVDVENVRRFVELWRKAYANWVVVGTQLESRGATPEIASWKVSIQLLQESDKEALRASTVSQGPVGRISRLYTADQLPFVAGVEDKLLLAPDAS